MKIKVESEYNEIKVVCAKKKGAIKVVYIDEKTNEVIQEQWVTDLEIGKEYDIDLSLPNGYEIKEEKEELKEESYEDKVLKEMMRLRDAINE